MRMLVGTLKKSLSAKMLLECTYLCQGKVKRWEKQEIFTVQLHCVV